MPCTNASAQNFQSQDFQSNLYAKQMVSNRLSPLHINGPKIVRAQSSQLTWKMLIIVLLSKQLNAV